MSEIVKQSTELMELLPEQDKKLVYEFIKIIVLAWNPDYTKLTAAEKERIEQSRKAFENGDVYSHEDVWN